MNPTWVIFGKEVRESLRDRRVLLNSLVMGPLIGPLVFVLMVRLVVGQETEKSERALPVVVIGAERAPGLVEALRQEGMLVRPPVEDVEEAVRSQRVDLALRIAPDYAQDWRAGRPAQVELFYDSSRRDVGSDVGRLESMLSAVSQRTGMLRLRARGISPATLQPVLVASRDQATPRSQGALIFLSLPYFLAISALLGGMWLAIDATAGERERHSIEPLFANPVRRSDVVLGKALATASFGSFSLVLALALFYFSRGLLPPEQPQFALALTPGFLAGALVVMAPLVAMLSIVQMLLASFAKTFREAQTYLGLSNFALVIPSVVLMAVPLKEQLWLHAIPIVGQQAALLRMLRGEPPLWEGTVLCAAVTLALSWVFYRLTVRVFEGERFAFPAT
jgi:sodium transport system permease protein